jgi:hypothetical protein
MTSGELPWPEQKFIPCRFQSFNCCLPFNNALRKGADQRGIILECSVKRGVAMICDLAIPSLL